MHMNRTFAAFLLLAVWLAACAQSRAAQARQPNIIFILTDDLGLGDVGVFFQNARRATNHHAEPFHDPSPVHTRTPRK